MSSKEVIVELCEVVAEQARTIEGARYLQKELTATEQARYRQAEVLDAIAKLVVAPFDLTAIAQKVAQLVDDRNTLGAQCEGLQGQIEMLLSKDQKTIGAHEHDRAVLEAFVTYVSTQGSEPLQFARAGDTTMATVEEARAAVDRFLAQQKD